MLQYMRQNEDINRCWCQKCLIARTLKRKTSRPTVVKVVALEITALNMAPLALEAIKDSARPTAHLKYLSFRGAHFSLEHIVKLLSAPFLLVKELFRRIVAARIYRPVLISVELRTRLGVKRRGAAH